MRRKICMLAIFVVLFCMSSICVCVAGETHFSEVYDSQEEVPQPEQEVVNEEGEHLSLLRTEIEMIPVTGRKKSVRSHVIYEAVRKKDSIPESSVINVSDEETGQIFDKILPLKNKRYYNERWESFEFKVTFHSYGSDVYRLGTLEIPAEEPMPDMKEAESEVLAMAGMDQMECRIEAYNWSGPAYYDPSRELCRDALASAVQRVWDCDAVYGGRILLPDSARYRRASIYEKRQEETEGFEVAEVHSELTADTGDVISPDSILNRFLRFIKMHLSITIGVALLVIFILIFYVLFRLTRLIKRK